MERAIGWTLRPARALGLCAALTALAACEDSGQFAFLQPKAEREGSAADSTGTTTRLVERDVEAPEVFQVSEAGLWDGRPSLGGVWVAHPDVSDPERVIIRNTSNGKFVIGALFRREREIPGPRLQTSSDAASALGMLAGAPVELQVTALRRETVSDPDAAPEEAETIAAADPISEETLDPIASAGSAIDTAEAPATTQTAAAPAPTLSKPRASSLEKPYIQIGIFSVERNANNAASQMRAAGMVPTVRKQTLNDKPFWRVVVGPAQTSAERSALLKEIKSVGFTDAYSVTN
ncbi:SPOR domain-containing protein [Thalassococcus sp. S3]|uniref:SPOR domain-containing protein n=1 Tax=Thalassococcus sp. S3 TaxID=2017482 RepID=UPI00102490CD|nr:SPOR domain-containing protein [Thalassococcus sp. S3]QBF32616.1 SPOR domain-containing protein [Thalassococcus sp. S3]